MKVCTDACLFGAWTAKLLMQFKPDAKRILDIGTGTGLLSLMLAQKVSASIDAVEIDAHAAKQASINVAASAWKDIKVHNLAIANFPIEKKYDVIVSNPPFYERNLLSPKAERNAAMHDSYLTLETLVKSIDELMSSDGYAAVLLPFSREVEFAKLLTTHNLHIVELTRVRQSVRHDFFRSMFFISRESKQEPTVSEMSIHDNKRNYTDDFKEILKDYYLNF